MQGDHKLAAHRNFAFAFDASGMMFVELALAYAARCLSYPKEGSFRNRIAQNGGKGPDECIGLWRFDPPGACRARVHRRKRENLHRFVMMFRANSTTTTLPFSPNYSGNGRKGTPVPSTGIDQPTRVFMCPDSKGAKALRGWEAMATQTP